MLRNSVAFSAATGVRLGLGFLTWLAAARFYPASEVGIAAGAISAMSLCVQVGNLGADIALIALYPEHRDKPHTLLDTAITLSAVVAGTASALFVVFAAFGLHALHVLASSAPNIALFVALTVLQTAWWVIDQAGVAIRRTGQVLTRALTVGAVTLAGVVALGAAGFDSAYAILAAWTVAAGVAVLLGRIQLGRAVDGYRFRPRVVSAMVRRLFQIGLPNFALTTAMSAPALVLPIVAAELISRQAAAYWYAVWMMYFASYAITLSVGLNMFAETSWEPSELRRTVTHALRLGVGLTAIATVLLVAVGPLVLRLLGAAYADHATTALRVIAISAMPLAVTKAYLFTCRAVHRLREGTLAAGLAGALAVGLAAIGASHTGVSGIATGWVAGQLLLAFVAAVRLRTLVFGARLPRPVAVDAAHTG